MIYLAKKTIKKAQLYRHHQSHKNQAYKILKNIESVNGKLNPNLRKLCDEYAEDKLGWKGFAPWLYVYSAISNNFYEGWIPDNYYGAVVVPALKGKYGEIADCKALTNILFQSDLFPDLLYSVNGLFLS